MGRPTGRADLPLHYGQVPPWLASRMARLGRVVCEAIILQYGRSELLRRLAHPFWFQSLGCVMGMDWHSSGITTSVVGALKRGLSPIARELGLYVCGGRGRHSRATPAELLALGEATGFDGAALARASRLVAKVDSAAVQDGFQLYLHSFIVTDGGEWVVVQQGMDTSRRQARRYHWLSEGLASFVDEPHTAIEGPNRGAIINLTDHRAARARDRQVELVNGGPDRLLEDWSAAARQPLAATPAADTLPHLVMPEHHDVRAMDVVPRRLHAAFAAAAAASPASFEDLLLTPGVGARTVAALALVGEVMHGAPSRFTDPARFAFAHGGKDGHPFPVPLKVYDQTLTVMRRAVEAARLGNNDKLAALAQLDREARRLEAFAKGPPVDALIATERWRSPSYGGMTVFGPAARQSASSESRSRRAPAAKSRREQQKQMTLPGLAGRRR